MDIVYILGKGSVWEDNEIRFSLRSIEKNISDLGNVFVVGERPHWLRNIIYIPASDPFERKWQNASWKIGKACRDNSVSSDFLLMNDDFFIVKPVEAKSYPYYCTLSFSLSLNSAVLKRLSNKKGFSSFAVHRPFRYNKENFLKLPPPPMSALGFSLRTYYGNYYNLKGITCKDPLFSPLQNVKDFDRLILNYTDFSILSSTARSQTFRDWIRGRFPEPSRFEK